MSGVTRKRSESCDRCAATVPPGTSHTCPDELVTAYNVPTVARWVLEDGGVQVDVIESKDIGAAVVTFARDHDGELDIGTSLDWSDEGTDGKWWWSRTDIALTIRRVDADSSVAERSAAETRAWSKGVGCVIPTERTIEQAKDAAKAVLIGLDNAINRPKQKADRMVALCRTFPTLDRPDLPEPWNVRDFELWARQPWRTSGSGHAAQFIVAVWNGKAYDQDDRITTLAAEKDDDGKWPMWDAREGKPPKGLITTAAIRPIWTLGTFDAVQALSSWDAKHRDAFIAWCANPWWP